MKRKVKPVIKYFVYILIFILIIFLVKKFSIQNNSLPKELLNFKINLSDNEFKEYKNVFLINKSIGIFTEIKGIEMLNEKITDTYNANIILITYNSGNIPITCYYNTLIDTSTYSSSSEIKQNEVIETKIKIFLPNGDSELNIHQKCDVNS